MQSSRMVITIEMVVILEKLSHQLGFLPETQKTQKPFNTSRSSPEKDSQVSLAI